MTRVRIKISAKLLLVRITIKVFIIPVVRVNGETRVADRINVDVRCSRKRRRSKLKLPFSHADVVNVFPY